MLHEPKSFFTSTDRFLGLKATAPPPHIAPLGNRNGYAASTFDRRKPPISSSGLDVVSGKSSG